MDGSKPVVKQKVLVKKINGSQNKTKGYDYKINPVGSEGEWQSGREVIEGRAESKQCIMTCEIVKEQI